MGRPFPQEAGQPKPEHGQGKQRGHEVPVGIKAVDVAAYGPEGQGDREEDHQHAQEGPVFQVEGAGVWLSAEQGVDQNRGRQGQSQPGEHGGFPVRGIGMPPPIGLAPVVDPGADEGVQRRISDAGARGQHVQGGGTGEVDIGGPGHLRVADPYEEQEEIGREPGQPSAGKPPTAT